MPAAPATCTDIRRCSTRYSWQSPSISPMDPPRPACAPRRRSASTATKRYMTLCRLNQTDSCLEPLERAEQLEPLEDRWREYFVFTFVSGTARAVGLSV